MNLNFKDEQIFRNFVNREYHPNLAKFLWWWCQEFYEAIVTSAWRPTGIHGAGRALDLRSWIYSNPSGMETYVNDRWIYDTNPKKSHYKVVVLHDSGKGIHFHCQVTDRTVRNGGNS